MTTNPRVPTLGGGGGGSLPDPEALLVALVLVPGSYPRNRFFEMFRLPAARRARRRAANLRAMLDDLRNGATDVSVMRWGEGFELRYAMPEFAAVRRTRLDALELTLLAAILRRGGAEPRVVDPLCEAAGQPALEELAPVLARLLDVPR